MGQPPRAWRLPCQGSFRQFRVMVALPCADDLQTMQQLRDTSTSVEIAPRPGAQYRAEDVVTDRRDVPEVWWTSPDGSCHRYFVDIFIPAENRMIEVKSAYTAAKQGVCEKASACRDAGFEFEIWVYDRDGTRINVAAQLCK